MAPYAFGPQKKATSAGAFRQCRCWTRSVADPFFKELKAGLAGVNLGNALEAPHEGGGRDAQRIVIFTKIKKARLRFAGADPGSLVGACRPIGPLHRSTQKFFARVDWAVDQP